VYVRDRTTDTTERVSVTSAEAQADGASYNAAISGNGRYVAFVSLAQNLVAGDSNAARDIYVRDRQAGTTSRVSVSTASAQAVGGDSVSPSISNDGKYVTFSSAATNLVASDTNNHEDVFERNTQSGVTTRVSVATGGTQSPLDSGGPNPVSDDGRYVAFTSGSSNLVANDTNGSSDAFVHDATTNTTTRVSVSSAGAQGNAASSVGDMDATGDLVSISSSATNLVTGDTNGHNDSFVRSISGLTTTRASLTSNGAQIPGGASGGAMSSDGSTNTFGTDNGDVVTTPAGAGNPVPPAQGAGRPVQHDHRVREAAAHRLRRAGAHRRPDAGPARQDHVGLPVLPALHRRPLPLHRLVRQAGAGDPPLLGLLPAGARHRRHHPLESTR